MNLKAIVLIFCAVFFGVIGFFVSRMTIKDEPGVKAVYKTPEVIPSPTPFTSTTPIKLSDVVTKALEGSDGTYSIAIKNLRSKESYFTNEHKEFDAGSLYKLWVMVTAFNQISDKKLDEEEILSEDVTVLNNKFDIDPGLAEMTSGTISLSVKEAIEQMITISHNYAALLLTERVRLLNVSKFLKDNGFNESKVGLDGGSPTTTASDMALFFEKLYKGDLADAESTREMLDLLQNQTFNNKLPRFLPKNIVVAHKTGEIDYLSHDAGIVFSNKGDYVIAVLSQSDNPPGAEERIAGISRAVFDYFQKEPEKTVI